MSVSQFPNAMLIFNNTNTNLSLSVQANGFKELFSPSWTTRNVPPSGTSDGYTLNVPSRGTATLGAGICRDGGTDQSAIVTIGGYGTLTFNGSHEVNGGDIAQNIGWNGSANVKPSGPTLIWNFNHTDQQLMTLTFS